MHATNIIFYATDDPFISNVLVTMEREIFYTRFSLDILCNQCNRICNIDIFIDATYYFFICNVMNGADCVVRILSIDSYFISAKVIKVVA